MTILAARPCSKVQVFLHTLHILLTDAIRYLAVSSAFYKTRFSQAVQLSAEVTAEIIQSCCGLEVPTRSSTQNMVPTSTGTLRLIDCSCSAHEPTSLIVENSTSLSQSNTAVTKSQ